MSDDTEKKEEEEFVGQIANHGDVQPPVDEKLEKMLNELPPEQRETVRSIMTEMSLSVFKGSMGPNLDPKTAAILVQSADRDNDHKFEYLCKKQEFEHGQIDKDREFEKEKHRAWKNFFGPILITTLIIVTGCIGLGIYFSANNIEPLGSNLLAATMTGVFAFLAGLGFGHYTKK